MRSGAENFGQWAAAGLFESNINELKVPTFEQGIEASLMGNQEELANVQRTVQTRQAATAGGEQVDTSRYGGAGLAEANRGP
jgi:hypothetical protein